MKRRLLFVSLWIASVGIASGSLDTDKIDQVTGLKGKLNKKPPEIPYTEVQSIGNFGGGKVEAGKSVAKAQVAAIAVKEIGGSCSITSALGWMVSTRMQRRLLKS